MASIIKRASGWQVQIRKQGYQPISKRFDKKADADIWAKVTESEMDRGVFIDCTEAEKTTLADILQRYLAEVSVRKLGYKQELSRIKGMLSHPISSRFLATLKSSDFTAYKETRLAVVCGTTVNKELNLLGNVIDTARRDWSINMENSLRTISRPKNNRPRDRRLNDGELNLIIDATESPTLSNVVLFALETAMRRGELAKAKWTHLQLSQRVLFVPETKTGVPRSIPLSNRAISIWAVRKMFKEDIYYQKAGVLLTYLVPEEGQQLDIFGFSVQDGKSQVLMETMDKLNKKYNKHIIKLASEGTKKSWVMRRSLKSPNYTTDWKDLPTTTRNFI